MAHGLPVERDIRIGVVGLGYVGLPLALEFAKRYPTVGYDTDAVRVAELRSGRDRTGEADMGELRAAARLALAQDAQGLRGCNVYIVAVPTPVDEANQPDLGPLLAASETVGAVLKPGDVVVYESTVYPGTTEEVCVPVLERASGLKFNRDFACGYSPERINPGDRGHRLPDVVKVTSGSSPEAADFVDGLYRGIVRAGTHKAPSIRVAEAAKAVENTQRDVNIALVNELAMMFDAMGIRTRDVLEAAGTKWNFLPFRPGLVGGHCIGVDPYYLSHKATQLGYHPELMLSARRINNRMGLFVAHQLMALMARRRLHIVGARVLVLGLAFKEDCPDLRNTRVADIVHELRGANADVDVHDPWVDPAEAEASLGLRLVERPEPSAYDAVVLAVAHREFVALGEPGLRAYCKPGGVLYLVKDVLAGAADGSL